MSSFGNNFHVVMYDVLDKLNDPAIRAQHGLPDNIASEIGLEPIRKRYDKLMIEAGTVKKVQVSPMTSTRDCSPWGASRRGAGQNWSQVPRHGDQARYQAGC